METYSETKRFIYCLRLFLFGQNNVYFFKVASFFIFSHET